jgi:hypothetical protein
MDFSPQTVRWLFTAASCGFVLFRCFVLFEALVDLLGHFHQIADMGQRSVHVGLIAHRSPAHTYCLAVAHALDQRFDGGNEVFVAPDAMQ